MAKAEGRVAEGGGSAQSGALVAGEAADSGGPATDLAGVEDGGESAGRGGPFGKGRGPEGKGSSGLQGHSAGRVAPTLAHLLVKALAATPLPRRIFRHGGGG